jgi:molybdopterin-guanine dinucleotide biosynthesis protein A
VLRADLTAQYAPVVVSPCDTPAERREAVSQLLEISAAPEPLPAINLDGADRAVDEILAIVTQKHAR